MIIMNKAIYFFIMVAYILDVIGTTAILLFNGEWVIGIAHIAVMVTTFPWIRSIVKRLTE